MSASTLLINGKINPSLVPASAIPQQPTFQTLTISPPAGLSGYMRIESESGAVELIKNDNDSRFTMVNNNETFVSFNPDGTGTATFGSTTINDVSIVANETIQITAGSGILLGNSSLPDTLVDINGSQGQSRVYDVLYNPISQPFVDLFGTPVSITTGTTTSSPFVPPRTGIYNFSISFSLDSASVIGTGPISYAILQYLQPIINSQGTLVPSSFVLPASGQPDYVYTYSHNVYLTENIPVAFEITAGAGWNALTATVQYSQMC